MYRNIRIGIKSKISRQIETILKAEFNDCNIQRMWSEVSITVEYNSNLYKKLVDILEDLKKENDLKISKIYHKIFNEKDFKNAKLFELFLNEEYDFIDPRTVKIDICPACGKKNFLPLDNKIVKSDQKVVNEIFFAWQLSETIIVSEKAKHFLSSHSDDLEFHPIYLQNGEICNDFYKLEVKKLLKRVNKPKYRCDLCCRYIGESADLDDIYTLPDELDILINEERPHFLCVTPEIFNGLKEIDKKLNEIEYHPIQIV